MKYKIGDKVKIQASSWYKYSSEGGNTIIDPETGEIFVLQMSKYCGEEATITDIDSSSGTYKIDLDDGSFDWAESFFVDQDVINAYTQYKESKLAEFIEPLCGSGKTASIPTLSDWSDEDLCEELGRRGYTGSIDKTIDIC